MTETADSEGQNVFKDRAKFLENLQREVDVAFENRAIETPAEGTDTTVEQLEEAKEFYRKIEGKPDDEIVDFGPYQRVPHEVVVENPHDYRDLLRMALMKFWTDEDYVNFEVNERLKHELAHHVVLLGYEGCRQAYGVHFYRERNSKRSNFTRFVTVEGKAPVGLVRKSIEAVPNPSSGDAILLGK